MLLHHPHSWILTVALLNISSKWISDSANKGIPHDNASVISVTSFLGCKYLYEQV